MLSLSARWRSPPDGQTAFPRICAVRPKRPPARASVIQHRAVLPAACPQALPYALFRTALANVLQFFADLCLYLPAFHYLNILAFNGPYIPVFQNLKAFRHEALRIIIPT